MFGRKVRRRSSTRPTVLHIIFMYNDNKAFEFGVPTRKSVHEKKKHKTTLQFSESVFVNRSGRFLLLLLLFLSYLFFCSFLYTVTRREQNNIMYIYIAYERTVIVQKYRADTHRWRINRSRRRRADSTRLYTSGRQYIVRLCILIIYINVFVYRSSV